MVAESCALLAVDLGLKTGVACFDRTGRPLWARSRRLPSMAALKRWLRGLLLDMPVLEVLVLEGGGAVATAWEREAVRRDLEVLRLSAEEWRGALLFKRQRGGSSVAKAGAGVLARRILVGSGVAGPTPLTHDAAEALCIGHYAVGLLGWTEARNSH
jgi:hypothetical protein